VPVAKKENFGQKENFGPEGAFWFFTLIKASWSTQTLG
jgi:hypothetical protein